MDYADLLRGGASSTEMREFLVGGETVAVTIRIPRNLRDSAKRAARLGARTSPPSYASA